MKRITKPSTTPESIEKSIGEYFSLMLTYFAYCILMDPRKALNTAHAIELIL